MYIVSQPGNNFETTIISIIFPKNKKSECTLCLTCACAVGQGDVIGDGEVCRQGGIEVLSITDWVASQCTVVEIEMLEAGSGKQGGLGVEDGGQEEDGN